MKIKFLGEGSEDCPLLRLFDYLPGEIELLRVACRDLAGGRRSEFALHDQPWVESVAGCRFHWRAAPNDVGVELPATGNLFVLALSDEGWREVGEKLLPFADGAGGFNWLTNEGDVNVLISRDGKW